MGKGSIVIQRLWNEEDYLDVSEYLQEEGPEQIALMPTLSQVRATWWASECYFFKLNIGNTDPIRLIKTLRQPCPQWALFHSQLAPWSRELS